MGFAALYPSYGPAKRKSWCLIASVDMLGARWRHAEFCRRFAKTAVPGDAQERLDAVERACLTVKFCFITH